MGRTVFKTKYGDVQNMKSLKSSKESTGYRHRMLGFLRVFLDGCLWFWFSCVLCQKILRSTTRLLDRR